MMKPNAYISACLHKEFLNEIFKQLVVKKDI